MFGKQQVNAEESSTKTCTSLQVVILYYKQVFHDEASTFCHRFSQVQAQNYKQIKNSNFKTWYLDLTDILSAKKQQHSYVRFSWSPDGL